MNSRQLDDERAAVPRFALNGHAAAVRFDNPAHEVKPEAAPLNLPGHRLAAAVKRLEAVCAILCVNPESPIFDRDPSGPMRRRPCADFHPRSAAAVLDGVANQILDSGSQGGW